eukprot:4789015-Heterocapsa_arctica.AAC.1
MARHTDTASGLGRKETWWTCKHCRCNNSDNMGLSWFKFDEYATILAQSNRHEGSGPLATTTYARNGLDNPKWKNVGGGTTERQ